MANKGTSWTEEECETAVAAYLEMFEKEINGIGNFTKADYNRSVVRQTGRTRSAVERKFQNISHCLENRYGPGFRIQGYKSLSNRQNLLDTTLETHSTKLEELLKIKTTFEETQRSTLDHQSESWAPDDLARLISIRVSNEMKVDRPDQVGILQDIYKKYEQSDANRIADDITKIIRGDQDHPTRLVNLVKQQYPTAQPDKATTERSDKEAEEPYPWTEDSWTILSHDTADKTIDKSAFDAGTVVSGKKVAKWFGLPDEPGINEHLDTRLLLDAEEFGAYFAKSHTGSWRLFWKKTKAFRDVLRERFPDHYERRTDKTFAHRNRIRFKKLKGYLELQISFNDDIASVQLPTENLNQLDDNSNGQAPILIETESPEPRHHHPISPRSGIRKSARNYEEEQKRNSVIGNQGEVWVVKHEKERLIKVNRADLAKRVTHIAVTEGDGAGYDVLSFDPKTKQELYIEVKTTTGGKSEKFYMSSHEKEFSRLHPNHYRVYRLYGFNESAAKMNYYVIKGDITKSDYDIEPINFVVKP
jgi:hypothetical protein